MPACHSLYFDAEVCSSAHGISVAHTDHSERVHRLTQNLNILSPDSMYSKLMDRRETCLGIFWRKFSDAFPLDLTS